MPSRDIPARPTTPSGLMSSRPAAATPDKKKRPIEAAFARVTDSGAKRKARPRADRPAPRGLNFVDDDADADEPFVPKATHKLLGYAVKGTKRLPEGQAALAAWVETACDVPDDFEAQHKRGPGVGRLQQRIRDDRRAGSETLAVSRSSSTKGAENEAPASFGRAAANPPQKRYGSKSGTSYEERLLDAYVHGLLDGAAGDRRAVRDLVLARDWDAAAAFCDARAAAE